MYKRYLTLALCFGAVALAGCGSSSSSASGTGASTGPASAAVFSSDLNALCKQAITASKAVQGSPSKTGALLQSFVSKFKALTAPGAQQAVYSQFVASLQKEATALKAGDSSAASAAGKATDTLAGKLNAPACSGSS